MIEHNYTEDTEDDNTADETEFVRRQRCRNEFAAGLLNPWMWLAATICALGLWAAIAGLACFGLWIAQLLNGGQR